MTGNYIRFKITNTEYIIKNNRTPLLKNGEFPEEIQDAIFKHEIREEIKHFNRCKAQKERRRKEKIAKTLGIPFEPISPKAIQKKLEMEEKMRNLYKNRKKLF